MNYQILNYIRIWPACMALLLLNGCASLPPADPAMQGAVPHPGDFVLQGQAAWPQAAWWQRYQDAQLNRLIEQAVANSPSMALAEARLRQAASDSTLVAAQAGASLNASAQATRELYTQNSIYPKPLAGSYDNSGLLHLDFSYDFDFWGRNSKALEAALGREQAARADRAAAANTLSAAIADTYFQWQSTQRRIALNQETTQARQDLARLAMQRIKAGISPGDDLHPLQADLTVPEQTAVQLETRSRQLLSQLHALLGLKQDFPALQVSPLPSVHDTIPADLTMDLLAHRPDIAAARDRVQAALADVESARAAFYPDINLSAFIGLNSLQFSTLLHSSSREQGVTPAIHLPLFDAGRLRAALDSQRANAQAAGAEYDQTVTTAVQEVNDAILRLQGSLNEGRALDQQLQARTHALDNTIKRRAAGLADHMDELHSRLAQLESRRQIIDQQQAVLDAQIDLIKALGGGYDSKKANG